MIFTHPLVIFLIVCSTAFVVKKGFCSWVCPFGLLSDILAKFHFRLFHRTLALPRWIDTCLRSLKYLLAGFFIYYIFYKMPPPAIEQFIQSPYNRFADIQMLAFFTDISPLALKVMLGLIGLSFGIPYFWCRYLCPYGAALSVLGFLSIGSIQRDPDLCIQCGACEHHCPGRIQIRKKQKIRSPECSACLSCVTVCPEKMRSSFLCPGPFILPACPSRHGHRRSVCHRHCRSPAVRQLAQPYPQGSLPGSCDPLSICSDRRTPGN